MYRYGTGFVSPWVDSSALGGETIVSSNNETITKPAMTAPMIILDSHLLMTYTASVIPSASLLCLRVINRCIGSLRDSLQAKFHIPRREESGHRRSGASRFA